MGYRISGWMLACFMMITLIQQGSATDEEDRLVKELFSRYNRLIRPVKSMNETVTVRLKLLISLIISVEERDQVMKTNNWLEFQWLDPQLVWDPIAYGNIQKLILPPEKLWTPDVVLINNADGKYAESYRSNIVVSNDGSILWSPPTLYKSTCDIKVQNFPFDEQVCDLKFQSWTYNADEMMLTFTDGNNLIDTSKDSIFLKGGTWDVVIAYGNRNIYRKSAKDAKMVDITYKVVLRRKPLFYTINLVIPTVLITFLSILVFYLPTVAGEKVALSISILLTLNVFLLLVSKLLPPASDLPLIGKFLLFAFLMNLISIVVTVATINLNFRSPKTHTMPRWLRIMFLKIIPKILLMRRPPKSKRPKFLVSDSVDTLDEDQKRIHTLYGVPRPAEEPEHQGHEMRTLKRLDNKQLNGYRRSGTNATSFNVFGESVQAIEDSIWQRPPLSRDDSDDIPLTSPDARLVLNSIDCIVRYHEETDAVFQVEEDWKYVALVVDRLLLWIFFVASVAGSVHILLSAETIFETLEQAQKRYTSS